MKNTKTKRVYYVYNNNRGWELFNSKQLKEAITWAMDYKKDISELDSEYIENSYLIIFDIKTNKSVVKMTDMTNYGEIDCLETYLCELAGVDVPNPANMYGIDKLGELK